MGRNRIIINPSLNAGQATKISGLLNSLITVGLPSSAREVYRGRNTVVSLSIDDPTLSPLNIKQFHRPHFLNAFIYGNLRLSKAERSYRNALTLLDNGFHTPEPLGIAENYRGASFDLSYYVCRHLDIPTLRDVERSEEWPQIMDALGLEIARLHSKGIFFRDFSPGNILIEKREGDYRFYYIDLNRMDFGVTSRDKLMNMFRAVIFYDPAMTRLAESYAKAMGLNPDATAREALKRRKDFVAYLDRKRALKTRIKRIFK